jgi:hypothetical protein
MMDEDLAQLRVALACLLQVGIAHGADSLRANKTPLSLVA